MRCFNCEECRNHQFSQLLVCFIFQKSLEESSCFMKTANCEHFLQLQEKSLNLGNKKLIFYLKVRIILYAKLSLQKINGLCSVLNYNYYDINTKKDVNDYILILKANRNKIEV